MSELMINPPLPHLTGQKISNQSKQQQTLPTPVRIVFNVGAMLLAGILFYLAYTIYPAAIYARNLNGAHNLLVTCIVFFTGGGVLMGVSIRNFTVWYEYSEENAR